MNDLMFRDESESVARRASASMTSPTSGSQNRERSPDREAAAKTYFFQHFISPGHLDFLEGAAPDKFPTKTILACGMAGLANREGDQKGLEMARRYYVEAIAATNIALRHPIRIKQDSTLISIHLLALFEVGRPTRNAAVFPSLIVIQRLTWEASTSVESWKQHVEGSAQVLELRDASQIRTPMGAALFRDIRASIVSTASKGLCSADRGN